MGMDDDDDDDDFSNQYHSIGKHTYATCPFSNPAGKTIYSVYQNPLGYHPWAAKKVGWLSKLVAATILLG